MTLSHPARAVQGVVFDLDGTLTRPGAIDFAEMRRRIGMEERGSVLHWIERTAQADEEAARLHAIVDEVEAEALARMEPAEGLDRLLDAVEAGARRGLRAGISTRNSAAALVRFGEVLADLGRPGLDVLFPARVARGHHSPSLGRAVEHKPSPEPAHECLRIWGLDDRFPPLHQSEANAPTYPALLFVGDDIDDCRCGRRAGFEAALIENDEVGRGRFAGDPAARRVVSGLDEVSRWLSGA